MKHASAKPKHAAAAALAALVALAASASPAGAEGTPQGVTYASDVAEIIQNNCQECHRPGQAVPMTFMNYKEVRPWVKSIKKVVLSGEMPPWHAKEGVGEWKNERRLSQEDKEKILAWTNGGAPLGDPYDLPPAKQWTDGWQIGEPDAVFRFRKPEQLAADLIDEYRYVTMKTDFAEDRWLKAVECKPGNTEVVHHIIAFTKAPDAKMKTGGGPSGALGSAGVYMLGGYAPGMNPHQFGDGHAILLPAGAEIVFQMHYHKETGEPATDSSSVGIKFADYVVKSQHQADFVGNLLVAIPPRAENHRIEAVWTAHKDAELLTILPHMHLRGKSMRVWAKYPDGRTEDLLDVPKYDFNWQTIYETKEPLHLPQGTKLYAEAYYDNSENNPYNPDPEQFVRFGEETWNEMMFAFIGFNWAGENLGAVDPSAKYLKSSAGGR